MARPRRRRGKPPLVRVVVRLPQDWSERLAEMKRDKQPISDLIRELLHPLIDTDSARPLSQAPLIGRPRR